MISFKTPSMAAVGLLAATSALPLAAQVSFSLSTTKTFRQLAGSKILFRGGEFTSYANDGTIIIVPGCDSRNYFPPGLPGPCVLGTTGFVSFGNAESTPIQNPYLVVTGLRPAVIFEPDAADRIRLTAAPASKLPRPAAGFTDASLSLYYDLTTFNIQEYKVSSYYQVRKYSNTQLALFNSEIVPGAYHYSFPRLGAPNLVAPLAAVIYPMVEGYAKLNNRWTGFYFSNVNGNVWTPRGCVQLSYLRPNTFTWTGLTTSLVYPAVDSLYFSIKALRNPADPANSEVVSGYAIFPGFADTAAPESRILLPDPYRTTFTTPPILPGGTIGMAQVELVRNMQTGGVTYDFSKRIFQIPVEVVDSYTDFVALYMKGAKNTGILMDNDGDGYNNLTEWILNSDPLVSGNIPVAPDPVAFQAVDAFGPTPVGSYFGFDVNVRNGTVPTVTYTLQRSKNNGVTWEPFVTDLQWSVERVTTVTRGITTTKIQVRSLVLVNPVTADTTNFFVEPPGTAAHIYRVLITTP